MTFELIEKTDRRIYDDEAAYVDYASWLDAHGLTQDRRRINIITKCNSPDGCCCHQSEEEE